MNVSLTDDLSAFVAEQLADGYNNQSEVVRDGFAVAQGAQPQAAQPALRH